MSISVKSLVSQLPLEELRDVAGVLLRHGMAVEDVIGELVDLADALVDWTKVIRGPVGVAVEAFDGGPLMRAILSIVVRQVARRGGG